jgi:hypothetical protein
MAKKSNSVAALGARAMAAASASPKKGTRKKASKKASKKAVSKAPRGAKGRKASKDPLTELRTASGIVKRAKALIAEADCGSGGSIRSHLKKR